MSLWALLNLIELHSRKHYSKSDWCKTHTISDEQGLLQDQDQARLRNFKLMCLMYNSKTNTLNSRSRAKLRPPLGFALLISNRLYITQYTPKRINLFWKRKTVFDPCYQGDPGKTVSISDVHLETRKRLQDCRTARRKALRFETWSAETGAKIQTILTLVWHYVIPED